MSNDLTVKREDVETVSEEIPKLMKLTWNNFGKLDKKQFENSIKNAKLSKNLLNICKEAEKSSTIENLLKTASVNTAQIFLRRSFEPHEMSAHIMNTARSYYSKDHKNSNEETIEKFRLDVNYMITMFIGNHSSLTTVSPDLKERMTELARIYGLSKIHDPVFEIDFETPYSKNFITPSRVAVAFAPHAVLIAKSYYEKFKIDVDYGIPSCKNESFLHAPTLATVLPKDVKDSIHHFLLLKSFVIDRVLHNEDRQYSDPQTLIKNHRAVFNSQILSEKERMKFCNSYLFLYENNVLVQKYKDIDDAALALLSEEASWKKLLPFRN